MLRARAYDSAAFYHLSLEDFSHVASQPVYQHPQSPILGRCITISWHTEAAYIKVREGDWKSPLLSSTGSFTPASVVVAGLGI